MDSSLHLTATEMFRHRPDLAVEMLTGLLGRPLPAHRKAVVSAAEVIQPLPELHADAVVLLEDGGRTVGAVIVEVQLSAREDKRWTWPVYVTALRRAHRCPTQLLVLCLDDATTRWARSPIDLDDNGSFLRPAVVGPDRFPVITDVAEAARNPELTALSVLAHAGSGALEPIDVLTEALATIDVGRAVDYAHLVLAALPDRARLHMEELMATQTHHYESEFTRRLREEGRDEGREEGREEGRVQGGVVILLQLLAGRGIEVPEAARERIAGCTDLDQLARWTRRAVHADSIDDVL